MIGHPINQYVSFLNNNLAKGNWRTAYGTSLSEFHPDKTFEMFESDRGYWRIVVDDRSVVVTYTHRGCWAGMDIKELSDFTRAKRLKRLVRGMS